MNKWWIYGTIFLLSLTSCTAHTDVQQHTHKKDVTVSAKTTESPPKKTEPALKTTAPKAKVKEKTVQPRYRVDAKTWSIKPIVAKAPKNVVLITIDDAPDRHALEMAETLKQLNANAIFFLNGHFLTTKNKMETVKKLDKMGFLLGDHTYSHAYLPNLSAKKQEEEIMSVYDQIIQLTGHPPLYFRAPNGANTDTSREIAREKHMVLMNWSYGYDWNKPYETKQAITKIMVNSEYLHNGAILLMHDRPWTAEALKDIIKGLRQKGYIILDPHELKVNE